jgi:hypothetical protein
MYVVLVTETIVQCRSIVVSAPDEAAAMATAIASVKKSTEDMAEVSDTYAAEVVRAVVAAGAPQQDPQAKKTVAMRVIKVDEECTCRAGRHAGCPVPGHDDGDR